MPSERLEALLHYLRVAATLLGSLLAGIAVYLLLNQANTIEKQSDAINTLSRIDERRATIINYLACESEHTQAFLGTIGELILEGMDRQPETLEKLREMTEAMNNLDELCPIERIN